MTTLITLTSEELSKIITLSIFGFVGGVMQQQPPISIEHLHEVTTKSVEEGMHEEMLESFDAILQEEKEQNG